MYNILFSNMVNSDICNQVSGGIEYAVHKVVLVAHSRYFRMQMDCGQLHGSKHLMSSKFLMQNLHFPCYFTSQSAQEFLLEMKMTEYISIILVISDILFYVICFFYILNP